MKQMNAQLFQTALGEEKPVLVEFWAPWCVYCRRIAPALEKIRDEFEKDLIFGQVNIDSEPALSDQEQIEVIPTFVLYKDGKAVASTVAPESKAAIEQFIREALK